MWTCRDATPYIVTDGTAIFAARMAAGIYCRAQTHVDMLTVTNATGPGVAFLGDSLHVPKTNANALSAMRLLLTQNRVGLYIAGGDANGGATWMCNLFGAATGNSAEIGLYERGFLGNHHFIPQTAAFSGPALYLMNPAATGSMHGGYSEGSQGQGLVTGSNQAFGGTFGTPMNYTSAGPSLAPDGGHNLYERTFQANGTPSTPQASFHLATLNGSYPQVAWFQVDPSTDTYFHALQYMPADGTWYHVYANSTTYASHTITGSQSPDGRSFFGLPRGNFTGLATEKYFNFHSTLNFELNEIRGGERIVGDRIRSLSYASVGGYAEKIVTTAGWYGPVWSATGTSGYYFAANAPPLPYASPASVVRPTNPANTNAFQAQTTGAMAGGASEPNWALAPSPGNTFTGSDGITWKNMGPQPVLMDCNPISRPSTAPGISSSTGAGTNATVSISGTDTTGVITLNTSVLDTPAASADILSVTFATAYSAAPRVTFMPANDAAWNLASGIVRLRDADTTTTLFKLRSGATPLPATTTATYTFIYRVGQ